MLSPPHLLRERSTCSRRATRKNCIERCGATARSSSSLHCFLISPSCADRSAYSRSDLAKEARLARAFAPSFRCSAQQAFAWQMNLNQGDATFLAAVEPSTRYNHSRAVAQRIAMLPLPISVTGAVALHIHQQPDQRRGLLTTPRGLRQRTTSTFHSASDTPFRRHPHPNRSRGTSTCPHSLTFTSTHPTLHSFPAVATVDTTLQPANCLKLRGCLRINSTGPRN